MSARQRINEFAFGACVVVASVMGLITQSWIVFFVTLAIAAGVGLVNQTIRLTPLGAKR